MANEAKFKMGQRVFVRIFDVCGIVSAITRRDFPATENATSRADFTYRIDVDKTWLRRREQRWANEDLLQTIIAEASK